MEFLENTLWNRFQQKNFLLHGHNVILVVPETPALGNPWIWRTEFFGAFAYADLEMVKRGWHIAYLQVSDQYGCPKAVSIMKEFHDAMLHECSLSPKADLFGFSRGAMCIRDRYQRGARQGRTGYFRGTPPLFGD